MEGVKNRLKRSSLRHARTRFLLTPLFNPRGLIARSNFVFCNNLCFRNPKLCFVKQ